MSRVYKGRENRLQWFYIEFQIWDERSSEVVFSQVVCKSFIRKLAIYCFPYIEGQLLLIECHTCGKSYGFDIQPNIINCDYNLYNIDKLQIGDFSRFSRSRIEKNIFLSCNICSACIVLRKLSGFISQNRDINHILNKLVDVLLSNF